MKIFRNTRKDMLNNGKTSQYLKYATGEVILVVIGILIAIQIDSWRESTKEHKQLIEYLVKIKAHTKEDKYILDSLGKFRREVGNLCKMARTSILDKKEKENLFVISGAGAAFFDYHFKSNRDGYESLKNSIHFGKINNTRLDSLLTRYHRLVNEISQNEGSYNEYLNSQENFLSTHYDRTLILALAFIPQDSLSKMATPMSNYYKEIETYTELPTFRNVINLASYQFDWIADQYQKLNKTGEEVINEIDIYIN